MRATLSAEWPVLARPAYSSMRLGGGPAASTRVGLSTRRGIAGVCRTPRPEPLGQRPRPWRPSPSCSPCSPRSLSRARPELLARVVAPAGHVYGQNSTFILERFAEVRWSARLQKEPLRNVLRLDRPFDDPFPPDVRDLDAVLIVLFYHATVWMTVDRERMNRAVFRALAAGDVYGI